METGRRSVHAQHMHLVFATRLLARGAHTLRLCKSVFLDVAFDPVCSILPGALNLFSLSKNNMLESRSI